MLIGKFIFQQNGRPVKIIKANGDVFSEFIMHNYNKGISTARFCDSPRSVEDKPIFKKKFRTDKENYKHVAILPVISKTFERLIFKQLMFFEQIFSKYQSRCWKEHSAQHCLLSSRD